MKERAMRISTGTVGLDEILFGGLPSRRMYLLQGDPGVGKTTLALRFLLAGAQQGEGCLYVTLSETREELTAVAHAHGWSADGIELYEMAVDSSIGDRDENTLYVPAEVELGERIDALLRVDALGSNLGAWSWIRVPSCACSRRARSDSDGSYSRSRST